MNKIKQYMHEEWKNSKLALEPSTGGVPRVDVYKSKIIGNFEKVYYISGLLIELTKMHLFYVFLKREEEKLFYL